MANPYPVDLILLRNTIAICAFAVEARRVLDEINQLSDVLPKLNEQLKCGVEARKEWMNIPFPLESVLMGVYERPGCLDDQLQTQGGV